MPTYVISTPPSVNSLYYNRKGGGRGKTPKYNAWIKGELNALLAQRAKPIGRRAKVALTLPKSTRGDCDNRLKPVLDLLVKAGVLVDDKKDCVASVSATFGDVQMCHVSVEASA